MSAFDEDETCVRDDDTLKSYCKKKGIEYLDARYKSDKGCSKIKSALRNLQSEIQSTGWYLGEAITALKKTYGMMWDEIPVFRHDEIIMWFKNNLNNKLKIIDNDFATRIETHCIIPDYENVIENIGETEL